MTETTTSLDSTKTEIQWMCWTNSLFIHNDVIITECNSERKR